VLPPAITVCVLGDPEIVKSGGITTSVALALWLKLPLVPVIVSAELPVGVLLLVCTVSVELPEPVTDVGLNVAVAPVGNPLAVKLTLPAKPFKLPTFTVYVVLPPGAID